MPVPSAQERAALPLGTSGELPPWSRLILVGAARGWMIFAIVWGSVLYVGQAVVQGVFSHRAAAVLQANTVTSDYNATYDQLTKAVGNGSNGTLDTCPTLSCLQSASQGVANSLTSFSSDLSSMSFSSRATASSQRVESDVAQLHSFFQSLADASSIQQVRALAQRGQIDTVLQSYPGDVQSLVNDIRAG